MNREFLHFKKDIINSCNKIMEYTEKYNFDSFKENIPELLILIGKLKL